MRKTKPDGVKEKDWLLGRRIHKIRKKAGRTQEQLAELAKVSPTWIAYIETGRAVPSVDMLRKIARILNVRTHDLIPD